MHQSHTISHQVQFSIVLQGQISLMVFAPVVKSVFFFGEKNYYVIS